MSHLVIAQYDGMDVTFRDDGWFNATTVAARFAKEPSDWLNQRDTVQYMTALAEMIGKSGFVKELNKINDLDGTSAASKAKVLALAKKTGFVSTKQGSRENGGGTWLHPKLAVRFAQWLDMRFAVWCDMQIEGLMRGTHSVHDKRRLRHEASASHKIMAAVLQITRQKQGKECQAHHYMAESKLVNWALAGEFKGLDRDSLDSGQLDLLAKLEELNTVLIGSGADYAARKPALSKYAEDWRRSKIARLVA